VFPRGDARHRVPAKLNWLSEGVVIGDLLGTTETTAVAHPRRDFRPVTQDGLPLIGKVPQTEGAYVATGHSVWGILNAPATAEALTELIADGVASSTDLTPFDPSRLQ